MTTMKISFYANLLTERGKLILAFKDINDIPSFEFNGEAL
jgi:hypothetical protein